MKVQGILLAVLVVSSLLATAQKSQQQEPPLYSCAAEVRNVPPVFSGFWNPSPHNDENDQPLVTITITRNAQISLPCTGQVSELVVPNGQKIQVATAFDSDLKCSELSVTYTKPESQNAIADVFQNVIFKSGAGLFKKSTLGFDYKKPPTKQFPPLKNIVADITATCVDSGTNSGTNKYTQEVKVTYQNPPRLTASGGGVLAHGVRSYGVNITKTGTGSNGQATSQNTVAVTGDPSVQVIPFGFFNIYYAGTRKANMNFQLGVGVNPNLSSARLEYFASPLAFSWHDVYFSPGVHIGQHERISGGFVVGDVLPSSMTKVPLSWTYYTGFGFSISYNLHPLVSAASPKK